METNGTRLEKLDEYMRGLADVRQFLVDHPDLPPILAIYGGAVHLHLFEWTLPDGANIRDEFARHARTLMAGAPVGSIVKDASESFMQLTRKFAGEGEIILQADRDVVCERVVVGVEKVHMPDPTAPTVEVEREIVEWECTPILGATDAQVAHYAALDAAAEDEKAVRV